MNKSQVFNKIIVGGTFDRFHVAHQFILDIANTLSHHIIIGLTSTLFLEKVVSKDFSDLIQPYETRKGAVDCYLREKGHQNWTIMPIDDKWGKAHELEADALIVSEETYPEGIRINDERRVHNRPPLTLVVIPWVVDDKGTTFTSTKLRQDEDQQIKRNLASSGRS